MNPIPNESTLDDDPRLLRAAQEYLVELEAGRRPDRRHFAGRYPDLGDALTPYLDTLDAFHAAAPPRPVVARSANLTDEPLGDFRILREIGRGGMGVVYEAVQLSLGRRVALKVLPFAAALDAKQLQRFKNEAQAAACLHHQNIVPVYAVGSERGVHFYAMQLIDGQNLAALIEELRRVAPGGADAAHRPASEPTAPYLPAAPAAETKPAQATPFSTLRSGRRADFDYYRTAARWVAQAAAALDYAHGVGVIHRDVKPANLLVDGRGTVWVTDFGLAQFHAELGLTQTGDLVGTLRYMSPEQAGGQRVLIDGRTDVYSLGATLYELLTLRPIFDAPDRRTLLHKILHEEPQAPRAVGPTIPAELETIVLKAVAKTPSERYATAGDFAEDLHRFLRNEPIRARRATLLQRGHKWLRRHPAVPIAAVVLLVMLTAGSLVSAWLIQSSYQRERQRAEEAEQQFLLARQAVDEIIQLAERELADAPHQQGLRKQLLESALGYYQKFIDQRRDDPAAQAQLASTRDHVKKIIDDLAVLQGAGQMFLLGSDAVLEDLRLSVEQRDRLAALAKRLDEQRQEMFREFYRLTAEERRQRFLELARANDTALSAILSPNQQRRLRQIALQSQGAMAFRDAAVVADLKLTPEQRERLRTLEADVFFGKPDGPRPDGPRPGGPPRLPPPESVQKAVLQRMLAVLTKEQLQRWQELTGEPFRGPLPMCFPGPPRPFGPPGPR